MTNEKAFEKFILSDDWQEIRLHTQNSDELAEKVWQAAIAYMQEQSKEVVEAIRERDRLGFAVVNVIGKLDEIIENTQEVEIDDFLHIAISIDMWNELEAALEDMPNRADLYTTPQRQQPLKRLSDEFKDNLYEKYWIKESMTFDDLIEVVMDAMQEINKCELR